MALAQKTEDHASLGLQRFCVRFFTQVLTNIDDVSFIEIFHSWIQRKALPGILIDVADYRHLPDSPSVMLVGHEANLSIVRDGNRYSLSCQRKTAQVGTLVQRILTVVEWALSACELLEREHLLRGRLKFDVQQWAFIANDRLLAPNDEVTFCELRDDLVLAATGLYGRHDCHIEYVQQDPRERFTMNIRASRPVDARTLLGHLRQQRQG